MTILNKMLSCSYPNVIALKIVPGTGDIKEISTRLFCLREDIGHFEVMRAVMRKYINKKQQILFGMIELC